MNKQTSNKTKKEEMAQKLFRVHYDELCNPDRKAVREAIKTKGGLLSYENKSNPAGRIEKLKEKIEKETKDRVAGENYSVRYWELQAEIKGYQEAQDDFKKMIDERMRILEIANYKLIGDGYHPAYQELMELKSKLSGDKHL